MLMCTDAAAFIDRKIILNHTTAISNGSGESNLMVRFI